MAIRGIARAPRIGGVRHHAVRHHTVRNLVTIILLPSLPMLLTACVVPPHMNVTQGTAPKNLDKDVRFQATYYFRVFDYCWARDGDIETGKKYREVIPATDTLYRYRMTGKASALANKIHFESGTLPKDKIDPFGAVRYDESVGGFIYRSSDEAKAEAASAAASATQTAQRKAAAAVALDNYRALVPLYIDAKAKGRTEDATKLLAAMGQSLDQVTASGGTPTADQLAKIGEIKTDLEALQKSVAALSAGAKPEDLDKLKEAFAAELKTQIEGLKTALAAKPADPTICPTGEIRKKGFQVMGPEGMHSFDQDSRLILAMHSSAKPLIQTLSEYADRVNKGRINPAEQLLPLARETSTILSTRIAIQSPAATATSPTADDIFAAAVAAFGKDPK